MDETKSETDASADKVQNLSNPNYASVKRTKPQPIQIDLGSGEKSSMIQDEQLNSGEHDGDGIRQSSVRRKPVLLSNKSYEEHCFNKTDDDALGRNNTFLNANSNNKVDAEQVEAILPSSPTHHSHLGIFQFMKFEHDEDDHERTLMEALGDKDTFHKPLTCKEKLRHVLHSKPIHISIIVLVLIDALLVIVELLYDLQVIKQHQYSATIREVLHGFSIGILSMFMIELVLKLYADYRHFIHHKIEMLDAVVVTVSFILDIILVFHNTQNASILAFELILLLRLWRVFRILNGLIVAVKTKADERVHQFKMRSQELENALVKAQEKVKMRDADIAYLRGLLSENGIEIDEEKLSTSVVST